MSNRSIFEAIVARLVALDARRDNFDATVARVQGEQHVAASQSLHTDDVIAAFRDGIDRAAQDYEARLAVYFSSPDEVDVTTVTGADAALYFARDLIASKAPALVARLCPGAASGVTRRDRNARSAAIRNRSTALNRERDELRQAYALEKVALKEVLQQAIWERNRRDRSDIESELRRLDMTLEGFRSDPALVDRSAIAR